MMTLFDTIQGVSIYTQGLDASTSFDTFRPSLLSAERHISNLITSKVCESLSNTELVLFKQAVANQAMHNFVIFDTIEKRKNGTDTYKHEVEQLKKDYLNNSQSALAELYRLLDSSSELWKETSLYKLRKSLLVSEVEDFNSFYPIDNNYYFFMMLVPIQSEVLDSMFKGVDLVLNKDNRLLCRACVLLTLSKALERFDFSMLPITMRNSSADGAYRNASTSEGSSVAMLSKNLFNDGMKLLEEVKIELTKPLNGAYSDDGNDLNSIDSNFYFVG